MGDRQTGFAHTQREAAGTLSSGGVQVVAGTASKWTVTDLFEITNSSANAGTYLEWRQGGRLIWRIGCGGLFTKTFAFPGNGFYANLATSDASANEAIRLTFSAGTAKISWLWIGAKRPDGP